MKKFVVTKSQILHILAALVITPLSGFLAAWTAKHFPGMPHFTAGQLAGVFVTGAGAALSTGIHYLHGWQLWERTLGKQVDVEDKLTPPVGELQAPAPVTVHVYSQGAADVASKSSSAAATGSTEANEQSKSITGV